MFKKVSAFLVTAALVCTTVAIDHSDAARKRSKSSSSTATAKTQKVYFKNCSAARAAGAAPIYKGQPGYSLKLDRDKDGIACE